ncbi:hypothetical protein BESB_026720 [Besnoitia besnoiti]|uniref:Transmembrane protein n=1 Tax=Besnoitia besnoiti TaxID=94643 RepID=A0A2A9LZ53_BESBE|nr:uncharacterized protein BESB_026720 [Besnoitia besnoiti]PFH31698.1 hypothetical protein BESB_026720 [Besnoitia besnoiti]
MGPSRRPAASPAVAELALLLLTLSLSGSVLACKGPHHHHDEFESVRSLDRRRLEPVASIGETEVIASPDTASLLEEAPFQRREASREDTREESREGVDPRPGKMDMLFLAAMVDARAPGGEEVAGTVNIIRQSPRRDPAGVQQVSRTPSSVQERTRLEEQAKSSSQSDSQTQVSPEAGLEADSPQRPERPSVLELDVRGG